MNVVKPESVGMSSERLARIRPVMQRYVDEGKVPGVHTLVARHGQIAHSEIVGWADVEAKRPLAEDTIYRIYSMTKPITSAAVMMLYEEGRFQLNDPVSRYLPEFAEMQVLVGGTADAPELVPAERPITVKHLLTHTAGLIYPFGADTLDQLYLRAGVMDPCQTLAEMMSKLARQPLIFHPGSSWRYSTAIDVLGYLVQVVSGLPFERFLQERLFAPLGMVDTAFLVPPAKLPRFAQVYMPTEGGGLQVPQSRLLGDFVNTPHYPGGGGGLTSTMHDYLRFGQMLCNGGVLDGVRILGRKTLELMAQNHLTPEVLASDLAKTTLGPGMGFGLGGGVVMDVAQSGVVGSKGVFGWGGAASTTFRMDQREGLVYLLMTQLMNHAYPFGSQFRVLAYQALAD